MAFVVWPFECVRFNELEWTRVVFEIRMSYRIHHLMNYSRFSARSPQCDWRQTNFPAKNECLLAIDCRYCNYDWQQMQIRRVGRESKKRQKKLRMFGESNFVWCVILVVCTFVRSVKCRNGRNQHRNSNQFVFILLTSVVCSRFSSSIHLRSVWRQIPATDDILLDFLFTFVKGILSKN